MISAKGLKGQGFRVKSLGFRGLGVLYSLVEGFRKVWLGWMEPNEPVSVWSIPWSFGGVSVVCFYEGLGFTLTAQVDSIGSF